MSVVDHPWTRTLYDRSTSAGETLLSVIFGDRIGLTLFLGALVFVTTYWRVGVFITDSYTVANAMANVAEGHLHITHVIYGPESGATPGMKIHNGRLYGIHYGTVFAALPFLWGLQALAAVADLRIALAALWSLVVLAFCVNLGQLVDHRRSITIVGSLATLGLFIGNVAVATPLNSRWLALIALQTSTMVWAALLAVILYRLITHIYDRGTATFAGVALIAATPIGFWASIPKRHVLVALLALLTTYSFYRSRADLDHELSFRALSYVFIGVSAWVFPLEALLLLVALGPLDVLTARRNTARHLGIVATAFLVSLVPFFVTNTLITGNPLRPIWFLPQYSGQEQVLSGGIEGGTTSGTSGAGGGAGGGTGGSEGGTTGGSTPGLGVSLIAFVVSVYDAALARLQLLWTGYIDRGITTIITEPDRVYHTFVRSGYIERVAKEDGGEAINLALLESMPLLAALGALPAMGVRRLQTRRNEPHTVKRMRHSISDWLNSPLGQTDLLVVSYTLLVTLAYIPVLPTHAMVTARYLVPVVPGLVYLIVRLAPIRSTLRAHGRTLLVTWAGSVAIGGQMLVLAFLVLQPSLGEAMQVHAWLGLGIGLPLGTWAVVAAATDREFPRIGAVLVGLAAAVITVFLLLSGLVYFAYAGDFALQISQHISEMLPLLN